MTIKAIETRYKGYRFRSRLEARWAVFFDALSMQWEYEPQGYDLGESGWYLPDFWLPDINAWVEVKSDGGWDADDEKKMVAFGRGMFAAGKGFFILWGTPGIEFEQPGGMIPLPTYCVCEVFKSGIMRVGKHWCRCPLCGRIDIDSPNVLCTNPREWSIYCSACDMGETGWPLAGGPNSFHKGDSVTTDKSNIFPIDAYRAARSARFEHGETPR